MAFLCILLLLLSCCLFPVFVLSVVCFGLVFEVVTVFNLLFSVLMFRCNVLCFATHSRVLFNLPGVKDTWKTNLLIKGIATP